MKRSPARSCAERVGLRGGVCRIEIGEERRHGRRRVCGRAPRSSRRWARPFPESCGSYPHRRSIRPAGGHDSACRRQKSLPRSAAGSTRRCWGQSGPRLAWRTLAELRRGFGPSASSESAAERRLRKFRRPAALGARLRLQGVAEVGAAFANSPLEQPLRERRCHSRAYRKRTCRLAKIVTLSGVASEPRDVVLHPFQRRHLIHEAIVSRGVLRPIP